MYVRPTTPPGKNKIRKSQAFSKCLGLTIVNLGQGLEEIGDLAFYDCISLHEILIPLAVKKIKDDAFRGCSGLTVVNIGERLKGDWGECIQRLLAVDSCIRR